MLEGQERFCPLCGSPLERKVTLCKERPVCATCRYILFYNPTLVVVGILVQDSKVLLVRRAMNPGKGLWGMPGGYADMGEVLEEAVRREVWEETGLETQVRQLVGLVSEEGRPQVLAVYEVEAVGGSIQPGSEVTDAGFFPLDDLPPLAFPRDETLLAPYAERQQ